MTNLATRGYFAAHMEMDVSFFGKQRNSERGCGVRARLSILSWSIALIALLAGGVVFKPALVVAAAPPFQPVQVAQSYVQQSNVFQNKSGDVAISLSSDSVNYQASYWLAGSQLPSDLLHQQTTGLSEYVAGINDQGDVLICATDASNSVVRWLIWRTGRGDGNQSILQPPIEGRISANVYMNQQGDLSWQSWVSSAWRTYIWHPGDTAAAQVPDADGKTTYWWLIRNRTDPQNPSTASLVLFNQAEKSYIWTASQGVQPIAGFPAGASVIVPETCDASGNIAGYLNLGGQSWLIWYYRQSTGAVFVSSRVVNGGNFNLNNNGQLIGTCISAANQSDLGSSVWTLTIDTTGAMGEIVQPLPPGQGQSSAWGGYINDAGVVLGQGIDETNRWIPVLWKPDATGSYGSASKLQDCVPAWTRWGLSEAYSLSNSSQVMGIGIHNASYALWQLQPLQDTDGNGLPDNWQMHYFGHLGNQPGDDPDHDGLTNLDEYHAGTDPKNPDSDFDGIPDGWEELHGYDPLNPADAAYQLKHNGLTTLQEYLGGIDPSPRYTLIALPNQLPNQVSQPRFTAPVPVINSQLQIGITLPYLDPDNGPIGGQAFLLTLSGNSFTQSQILSWSAEDTGSTDSHTWLYGLNAQGKAVGFASGPVAEGSPYTAYLWSADSGKTRLFNTDLTYAYAVSDGPSGTEKVVGMRQNPSTGATKAFFWSANNGSPIALDITPSSYLGGYTGLSTVSINPAGTLVVGGFQDSNYHMQGFLWDPSQTPLYISFPPLPDGADNAFIAANSNGDLLGVRYGGQYLTGDDLPFYWQSSLYSNPIILPTLGGVSATGRAINNLGQIVGTSVRMDGYSHGFLWDPSAGPGGYMYDLNALIDNPNNLWEITDAAAITDNGDIVAQAYYYGSTSSDPNVVPGYNTVLLKAAVLDTNQNCIPDDWENYYFGHLVADVKAPAPIGNGHSILECFELDIAPVALPYWQKLVITIVSGNNQVASPNGFVSEPLIVSVTDATGAAVANTLITFTVVSGGGQAQASFSASPGSSLSVQTGADGTAKVFFQLPNATSNTSVITAGSSAAGAPPPAQFYEYSDDGSGGPYPSPFAPSSVASQINVDGSEDLTWQNNDDGVNAVPIVGEQDDGTWAIITTVPAGTTSFHFAASGYQALGVGDPPIPAYYQIPATNYAVINISGTRDTQYAPQALDDENNIAFNQYDSSSNIDAVYGWVNGSIKQLQALSLPTTEETFPDLRIVPPQAIERTSVYHAGRVITASGKIYGDHIVFYEEFGEVRGITTTYVADNGKLVDIGSPAPDTWYSVGPGFQAYPNIGPVSEEDWLGGETISGGFTDAGAPLPPWYITYFNHRGKITYFSNRPGNPSYPDALIADLLPCGMNNTGWFISQADNSPPYYIGAISAVWNGKHVINLPFQPVGVDDQGVVIGHIDFYSSPGVWSGRDGYMAIPNGDSAMTTVNVSDLLRQTAPFKQWGSQLSYISPMLISNRNPATGEIHILFRANAPASVSQLTPVVQYFTLTLDAANQPSQLDVLSAPEGVQLSDFTNINADGNILTQAQLTPSDPITHAALLLPMSLTVTQTQISSTETQITAQFTSPMSGNLWSTANPIGDGSTVNWSLVSGPGTGTLSATSSVTQSGVATVTVTHPENGTVEVSATLNNLLTGQSSFAVQGPTATTTVQGPSLSIADLDDTAGPAYRRVALNGRAIPESIDGQKAETESEKEESYVDALTLRLQHSVTDIYIPIENSELSLSVRRNLDSEVWNDRNGLRPSERYDRPFGAEWSSNLTPNIHFVYQQPNDANLNVDADYAYVTDEQGYQMRFVILGGPNSTLGAGHYFVPFPSSKMEQATFLATLTDNGGGSYTLTKERGTTLEFNLVPALNKTIDMDRVDHTQGQVLHQFAAINKVTDRLGYSLTYTVTDGLTPTEIDASTGQSISLTTDGHGHVLTAKDYNGNTITYGYGPAPALDGNEGQALLTVTHPKDLQGNRPIERYGYGGIIEADSRQALGLASQVPWYHIDLTQITDAMMNSYGFGYNFDHSRQQYDSNNGYFATNGIPRNVTLVNLPGEIGNTQFQNHSFFRATLTGTQGPNVQFDGYRSTYIIDAAGHSRLYQFLNSKVVLLNNFKPYANNDVNPVNLPRQVFYQTMQVTHFADAALQINENQANYAIGYSGGDPLGTETVTYDTAAGMAVSSYTDLNGHTTSYTHGDSWNVTDKYPWLTTYYPYGRYPEPTTRADSTGGMRNYTYDRQWRLMTSASDELLRSTQYTLGNQGQKTDEQVFDSNGGLIRHTHWDYDTTFPGFATRQTIKKLNGSTLSWESDLVTAYTPDGAGRIQTQVVDSAAGGLQLETDYTYDDNSNKKTVVDPRRHTTSFDYDNLNRLVKVTYPLVTGEAVAATKTYQYDLNGNKIAEVDERGYATLFAYDALNRLTDQARDMDGDGNITRGIDLVTTYGYNAVNSRTTVQDSLGNVTTTHYDGFERPDTVTQPPLPDVPTGYVTKFGYDQNSGSGPLGGIAFKPTSITDARGYLTTMDYDDLYRLVRKSVVYDQAGDISATVTDYDSVGNLVSQTDPRQNTTTMTYDGLNRLTQTLFADQTTQQVAYSSTGLKAATIDENQKETDYSYDTAGRLLTIIGPAVDDGTGTNHQSRPTTTNGYDNNGNLTSVQDPRLKTTAYAFDERNRKIQEIHPAVFNPATANQDSPTIQTGYDQAGNVTSVTDARLNTTTTFYDAANRPYTVTFPAAPLYDGTSPQTTRKTKYDLNSNIWKVTDQNNHTTTNGYDSLNRLTSTTDALGIVVNYGYDAANNRTSIEDGNQQITAFTYDGLNRNTSVTDPASKSTLFAYDGLVKTSRTDALGRVTHYDYDARNRLFTVKYDDGDATHANDRTYSYDNVGNLLSVTMPGHNGVANVAYTYDALNRAFTETSNGVQHAYFYDLNGNRTRVLYGGSNRLLVSAYDDDNRLQTLTDGAAVTTYVDDLNGNNVSLALPNGDVTTTVFDALNRRQSIDTESAQNALLQHFDYGYDGVGNVRTINESYGNAGLNRTVTNTYDNIDRLQIEAVTGNGACSTTYVYDNANNRTSKTVTGGPNEGITNYVFENTLNQIKSYTDPSGTTVTFGYDDDGNRVSSTAGNAVYTYDFENRLVSLTQNGNTYSYTYDYRSRRVERVENAATTEVVFSGGTSVQEYVNNALNVEYLRGSDWGGGVGGLLYSLRAGVPSSFTHYDGRGDVTEKTDGTGTVTYQATYEAYGTRPNETGSTQDRQKANTKEEDPSGLLNEGMRYRDLVAGVFITRDPAGFVDGPNLYTYVRQNPWSKFDPEGLRTRDEVQKDIARRLQENEELRASQSKLPTVRTDAQQAEYMRYARRIAINMANNLFDSIQVSHIEASAEAVAFATKEDVHSVLLDLDDQSDQFRDGLTLARTGRVGEMIASYYGGKILGAAGGKFLDAVIGRIIAARAARAFTVADVEAAIASLESKGIYPLEGQRPIDPNHVIELANKMKSGEWDPAQNLGPGKSSAPGYLKNPDGTRVIFSGHHRQIAEEMLRMRGSNFSLEKEVVPGHNVRGGKWSEVERVPDSR